MNKINAKVFGTDLTVFYSVEKDGEFEYACPNFALVGWDRDLNDLTSKADVFPILSNYAVETIEFLCERDLQNFAGADNDD